jgi:hypothetical protein
MELTTIRSHIIAKVEFYKEQSPHLRGCMPTDTYIELFFVGFNTLFTGKCYFIGKAENCAGETTEAKIIITMFSVIEQFLQINRPFILSCGSIPVGNGVILDIVKVD